MKKHFNEDGSVAYTGFMILLALVVAIMVWMSWSWIYDQFFAVFINEWISDGKFSLQTINLLKYNTDFLKYSVGLVLIMVLVFVVNAAVVSVNGGNLPVQFFNMGMVIFFTFTIGAFVLGFTGGYFIDVLHDEIGPDLDENAVQHMNARGLATYRAMQDDNIYFFINLFYSVCYAIPILGAAIWLQSCMARERVGRWV